MPTPPRPPASAPLHIATRVLDAGALTGLGHTAASAAGAVAEHAVVRGAPSFWLDSALPDAGEARWSIVGDAVDVLGEDAADGSPEAVPSPGPRVLRRPDPRDAEAAWAELTAASAPRPVVGGEGLPLRGGHVGFLGYELGLADLGVAPPAAGPADPAPLPALFWLRPSRYAVVDHHDGSLTCCVVSLDAAAAERGVEAWAARVRDALTVPRAHAAPAGDGGRAPSSSGVAGAAGGAQVAGIWRADRAAYTALMERCHRALREGESYELCLTTRFDVDPAVRVDPLVLFRDLAAHHPTPYAALIEHGAGPDRWAVVSASPERFLSGRDGRYSTKPIKGTAARHADPAEDADAARALAADPKTRAENLMIVDLLRNDLTRVCVPGSVQVPSLMAVESYASVHQLVSTVTGRALPGLTAVDVARSLFPGGSMTGAPKRRTVELLAQWEEAPRGVYSGALGLLSADGACELSIVIRTAVLAPGADDDATGGSGRWSIGAGGAIVADSDADAEYDEVLLKAGALRRAFARVTGSGDARPS
ncbi:anthranilate synthase component I family protein [Micrococcaceae bacterium Sec6.3]